MHQVCVLSMCYQKQTEYSYIYSEFVTFSLFDLLRLRIPETTAPETIKCNAGWLYVGRHAENTFMSTLAAALNFIYKVSDVTVVYSNFLCS